MRCELCPVAAGLPCQAEIHPPYCADIAASLPGRALQLIAVAEALAAGHVPPDDPPDVPEVDPAIAMRADLCRHGSGPCGCGAEPRLCSHPARPAEVWRPDCLLCATLDDWDGGPIG